MPLSSNNFITQVEFTFYSRYDKAETNYYKNFNYQKNYYKNFMRNISFQKNIDGLIESSNFTQVSSEKLQD